VIIKIILPVWAPCDSKNEVKKKGILRNQQMTSQVFAKTTHVVAASRNLHGWLHQWCSHILQYHPNHSGVSGPREWSKFRHSYYFGSWLSQQLVQAVINWIKSSQRHPYFRNKTLLKRWRELEAKDVLPNINCTQAAERVEKCRSCPRRPWPLTFKLVRRQGTKHVLRVWICRKSVQRSRRSAKNSIFCPWWP